MTKGNYELFEWLPDEMASKYHIASDNDDTSRQRQDFEQIMFAFRLNVFFSFGNYSA